MTDALTCDIVRNWICKTAEVMAENRAYLTELDSAIGDADHGNNMDRGYKAVIEKLPDGDDVGALLKAVSMALISKVGGAAGPLYGTMFLQASKPLMGKSEIGFDELAQFFDDAVAGVKMRGKADVGMKTMLDALVPAAEAFRAAGSVSDGLEAAVVAAEKGMKDTIPMIATKGRASYLGERSRDHQDPGATSSYLIIKALRDAASEAA
ncbi:dihydroxyacetone kinase subunit DhaL [Breoghania sp.]|uniref:dihydroxyacetone kinase subunit DhaL n=1 Tax=Breoghania sp. TaxID=2065378 RepID=UPI002AA747CF|nr:dihydroxyacetone kinase subunit DhaL [Breoghania sp.]